MGSHGYANGYMVARGQPTAAGGRGRLRLAVGAAHGVPLLAATAALLAVRLVLAMLAARPAEPRCGAGACLADLALSAGACALVAVLAAVAIALLCAVLLPASSLPPDSIAVVVRADAPSLFHRLDAATGHFGMARVETVHLSSQCNAAIGRRPALLAGRRAARLMIGLPLLEVLSEAELDAVVAHELGHLLGECRDSDLLDRAGLVVGRVAGQLGWLGLAAADRGLRSVWAEHTGALQGALSQRSEWAADAASAAYVGPRVASAALIRAALATRVEDEVDRRSRERMRLAGRPIAAPVVVLRRWMRRLEHRPDRDRFLRAAMLWHTSSDDSHPSLADRLARLGVEPAFPAAVGAPAGRLLEPRRAGLLHRTQRALADRAVSASAGAHRAHRWQLRQLAETDIRAAAGLLSPLETVEHADLVYGLRPPRQAIPALKAALSAAGSWPLLRYRLANCLIETGSSEGGRLMRELAHEDTDIAGDAAAWVADRLALTGDMDGARALVHIAERVARQRRPARVERLSNAPEAPLLAHALPIEARHLLLDGLRVHGAIVGAWLARRACRCFTDDACYLLAVEVDAELASVPLRLLLGRLADQLSVLPFRVDVLVSARPAEAALAGRIKATPGSALLERPATDPARIDTALAA